MKFFISRSDALDSAAQPTLHSPDITEKMLSLRLLTTQGQETVRPFAPTATVGDVKHALLADWPESYAAPVANAADIKLIHGGKVLSDTTALSALGAQVPDTVTVHVLLKKRAAAAREPTIAAVSATEPQQTQTQTENGTSANSSDESGAGAGLREEDMFHFHGCSVSQEEVEQMSFVFERKSIDNKLPFDRVHSFLVRAIAQLSLHVFFLYFFFFFLYCTYYFLYSFSFFIYLFV